MAADDLAIQATGAPSAKFVRNIPRHITRSGHMSIWAPEAGISGRDK